MKRFKSSRGESLVEGIVSILVFTVLIASVTAMISTSLRITATSTEMAGNLQNAANDVLIPGALPAVPGSPEIIFSLRRADGTPVGENISVPITVIDSPYFAAFEPVGS